ncbi:chromosome partitioning protein ParA [Bacteroides finegoldii DSM 17565]|nr:chromosome partitioning protein ParA [Bacteroides finegoldii DSM 17565]
MGKTTLCALFASYLAERGYPVIAIDADLQASLYRHRQREKDVAPDVQAPWNVDLLDTAKGDHLKNVMSKLKTVPGIVLIDCPGNLNDRNLEYIYKSADTAIIPISFDADTVDATGIFVKALKTVSSANLVFIPNRINTSERKSEELRQRAQTTEFLGLVGVVMPTVKQSVSVKRYTTLYPLERNQLAAVEPSFCKIVEELQLND